MNDYCSILLLPLFGFPSLVMTASSRRYNNICQKQSYCMLRLKISSPLEVRKQKVVIAADTILNDTLLSMHLNSPVFAKNGVVVPKLRFNADRAKSSIFQQLQGGILR